MYTIGHSEIIVSATEPTSGIEAALKTPCNRFSDHRELLMTQGGHKLLVVVTTPMAPPLGQTERRAYKRITL